MLGAYSLAFTAPDAVGSLSVSASGDDVIVIIGSIPVVESFMGVPGREQVGDPDALRALAFLYAVAAGCTGNQIETPEDITSSEV